MAAPNIQQVQGDTGPESGATPVLIFGTDFNNPPVTTVNFGAQSANFTIDKDDLVTAVSPPVAAGTGTVDIQVTNQDGMTVAGQFTYTTPVADVTFLSPAGGPSQGGSQITLTGTSFTTVSKVTFGGVPATTFTIISDTEIEAVSPPGSGTVDVQVVNPTGTSAAEPFAYSAEISSVTPSVGSVRGGTTVTLSGSSFTTVTQATFGGVAAASFTVNSDTEIEAGSPAGVGTVDVQVVNAAGPSSTQPFQYAPIVTSISPTQGPEPGGTAVTIDGEGFAGATAINFGSNTATFTVQSDTEIAATSPAGQGTVDVHVTTPDGTSPSDTDDQFEYVP